MAYYKLRLDVWCDWDPEESDLEENCSEHLYRRRYLYQAQGDCRRFGGEEGDAHSIQG